MVEKWIKRLKLMRISKYAIIICLLLALVFAGFTIYGINTGNFNVYITESEVKLALYMQDDKSDMKTHITVPTLKQTFDNTYADLPQDIAFRGTPEKGLGSKNDPVNRYIAFSLCLVNLSERTVDYGMALSITDVRAGEEGGDVVQAMRVAVIEGDNDLSTAKFYAMPEPDGYYKDTGETYKEHLDNELAKYGEYPSETIDFVSSDKIFDEMHYDLAEGGEVKYTFVLWLEGCDGNCEDVLFGGRVKMQLDFVGV